MTTLVFDDNVARIVGFHEAVALQRLHHWLRRAAEEKDPRKYQDGRWWIFDSREGIQQQLSYLSLHTVQRLMASLKKRGCILVRRGQARTWYSLDYDALAALRIHADGDYLRGGEKAPNSQLGDSTEPPNSQLGDPGKAIMDTTNSQLGDSSIIYKESGISLVDQRDHDDVKNTSSCAAGEASTSPTPTTDPPASVPKRRRKKPETPPAPRPRDPVFDALAEIWFDQPPGTPAFSALGGRIGQHVSWLKGNPITVRVKGQAPVIVEACPRLPTADELRRARKAWYAEHGEETHHPTAILKFVEYLDGWLRKHPAQPPTRWVVSDETPLQRMQRAQAWKRDYWAKREKKA